MILIYGIGQQLNPIKARLSDVIHSCMVDVFGLPKGKRSQRFFPMAEDDFYAPSDRSKAYTVIEINMMEGRKVETKKALITMLFERIESELAIAPVDIEIILHEQPAHCWGFRGMTGDEARLNYDIKV